jgi:hypothetical protein
MSAETATDHCTDECAEGGRHWAATRKNDDGSTYEVCTECGDLLSDPDGER